MDRDVADNLRSDIDRAERCQAWLNLETTQEFLAPLKEKLASLKDVSYEDIAQFDDKSFRSKVEAQFLAAKELEDYFAMLQDVVNTGEQAKRSLDGKDVEGY